MYIHTLQNTSIEPFDIHVPYFYSFKFIDECSTSYQNARQPYPELAIGAMGVARIFFRGGGNTFSKIFSKNSQKIFKKLTKNIQNYSKKIFLISKKFQKNFGKF